MPSIAGGGEGAFPIHHQYANDDSLDNSRPYLQFTFISRDLGEASIIKVYSYFHLMLGLKKTINMDSLFI